jgi:hypothetical protein
VFGVPPYFLEDMDLVLPSFHLFAVHLLVVGVGAIFEVMFDDKLGEGDRQERVYADFGVVDDLFSCRRCFEGL